MYKMSEISYILWLNCILSDLSNTMTCGEHFQSVHLTLSGRLILFIIY